MSTFTCYTIVDYSKFNFYNDYEDYDFDCEMKDIEGLINYLFDYHFFAALNIRDNLKSKVLEFEFEDSGSRDGYFIKEVKIGSNTLNLETTHGIIDVIATLIYYDLPGTVVGRNLEEVLTEKFKKISRVLYRNHTLIESTLLYSNKVKIIISINESLEYKAFRSSPFTPGGNEIKFKYDDVLPRK